MTDLTNTYNSNALNNFKTAYIKTTNSSEKDSLWSSLVTPLIEEISSDPDHSLVTFLYRKQASDTTTDYAIYLDSAVISMPLRQNGQLIPIVGTDLFYLTLKLPNTLRTNYTFLKLDPTNSMTSPPETPHTLFPFPELWGEIKKVHSTIIQLHQQEQVEIDYNNPKKIAYLEFDNPNNCFFTESILELPQAPSQATDFINSHDVAKKRQGLIKENRFFEKVILFSETSLSHLPEYSINPDNPDQPDQDRRKCWIYLPPEYDNKITNAYPLCLFLDGSDYLNTIPVPSILDHMVTHQLIPPCIAIFFEYSPIRRELEYYGDEKFTDFLADDLIRIVSNQHQLNISSDPKKTTIVGLSASGLAAIYAGLIRPDVFGNVITHSASLCAKKQNDLIDLIDNYLLKQVNSYFCLEAGSYETVPIEFRFEDGFIQRVSILESNQSLIAYMRSKNITAYFHSFVGGHNYICYKNSLPHRLKEVFDYRFQ